MTVNDPRPELAAMLAARLAPAAFATHAPTVAPDGAPAPIRGPASVLAAAPDRGPGQAPAFELVLRRLRRHRESGMDPGSGSGVTKEGRGDEKGSRL